MPPDIIHMYDDDSSNALAPEDVMRKAVLVTVITMLKINTQRSKYRISIKPMPPLSLQGSQPNMTCKTVLRLKRRLYLCH